MRRIGSVIKDTLRELKYDTKLYEHLVLEAWDQVVGEHIARHAQPESVRDKTLFVRVSTIPWMRELEAMEGMIIKRLNERIERAVINKLDFKLGEIPPHRSMKPERTIREWTDRELNEDDLQNIKKAIAHVRDSEIRDILLRTMIKDVKLRKFREGGKADPREDQS
ncbi:MAG: DUF721 domain-containing protein [Pseudomonadota bacterium]